MRFIAALFVLGIGPGIWFMNTSDAGAQVRTNGLAVVELFTSQSCSSCPPADAYLVQLEKEKDIIPIGCHVTYWDHLHWKDTLSSPQCTHRQRWYNNKIDKGVFTPQIVVNGQYSTVGSNRRKTAAVIAKAPALKEIPLRIKDGTLSATLHADTDVKSGLISVFLMDDIHEQSIPSGENSGRTVQYTNAVKKIIGLGLWDGTDRKISAYVGKNVKRVAFLIQDVETGRVISAGYQKLR